MATLVLKGKLLTWIVVGENINHYIIECFNLFGFLGIGRVILKFQLFQETKSKRFNNTLRIEIVGKTITG